MEKVIESLESLIRRELVFKRNTMEKLNKYNLQIWFYKILELLVNI